MWDCQVTCASNNKLFLEALQTKFLRGAPVEISMGMSERKWLGGVETYRDEGVEDSFLCVVEFSKQKLRFRTIFHLVPHNPKPHPKRQSHVYCRLAVSEWGGSPREEFTPPHARPTLLFGQRSPDTHEMFVGKSRLYRPREGPKMRKNCTK